MKTNIQRRNFIIGAGAIAGVSLVGCATRAQDNEIFDAFINWILKKNLPIHNILVYNTENKSYITKGVRRLNKNKYKTQVIKLEQLLKSLE